MAAFMTVRMIARARRKARRHASLVMTDVVLPRSNPPVGDCWRRASDARLLITQGDR